MAVSARIKATYGVLQAAEGFDFKLLKTFLERIGRERTELVASASYARGIEIGMRIALRHPEYAHLWTMLQDKSISKQSQTGNTVADLAVEAAPLNSQMLED